MNESVAIVTNLWRFSPISGYWKHERTCDSRESAKWLDVFQRDEPEDVFRLAKRRPTDRPTTHFLMRPT